MSSRRPICYIACALGGSSSQAAEYIAGVVTEAGWEPYLPHRDTATPGDEVPPDTVLIRNLAAVFRADCVVVETAASLGVGIELTWARIAGRPVILLNREGRYLSRMVMGLLPDSKLITYRVLDDARTALIEALQGLSRGALAPPGRGSLVVLEGRDGVGKTGAADRVAALLRAAGRSVTVLRDPPLIEPWVGLKEEFERGTQIDKVAECLLLLASRVDNTRRAIEPELLRGTTVILDRYFLSWLAYWEYSLRDTLQPDASRRHWLVFAHGLASVDASILQPDLTVFLEVSDEERRRRRASRQDLASKYDAEEVQTAVLANYEYYGQFTRIPPQRLDTSTLTQDQVAARVVELIRLSESASKKSSMESPSPR